MDPLSEEPRSARLVRAALFIASAAAAAATLRFTYFKPWIAAAFLAGLASVVAVRLVSRRRLRSLLRSGDVYRVLQRWSAALHRRSTTGGR